MMVKGQKERDGTWGALFVNVIIAFQTDIF